MSSEFKPTHELYDNDGNYKGKYRSVFEGVGYMNEDAWLFGGHVLSAEELTSWGWIIVPLSDDELIEQISEREVLYRRS